jgi:hypothetical protein
VLFYKFLCFFPELFALLRHLDSYLDIQAHEASTAGTTSSKRTADSFDESEGPSDGNSTKRQRRLERNRASATLSRERKKHVMKSLEQRVRELERANSHLSFALATKNLEVKKLSAEIAQLRSQDGGEAVPAPQIVPSTSIPPSRALGQKEVTESAALTADSLQLESTSPLSTLPACSLLSLFFVHILLPALGCEIFNGGSRKSATHMQVSFSQATCGAFVRPRPVVRRRRRARIKRGRGVSKASRCCKIICFVGRLNRSA